MILPPVNEHSLPTRCDTFDGCAKNEGRRVGVCIHFGILFWNFRRLTLSLLQTIYNRFGNYHLGRKPEIAL